MFDLPTADKMAGIRRFHARGNMLFSEGQFRRAAIQFRAALIWYEYTFPEKTRGPDGQAALDARRLACLLNLAACEISLHAWADAEGTCSQALRAQPMSAKAMYRRALARRHRHDFEGADADICAAIRAEPGSGALLREQALLRLTVREHRRRERRVAERMLAGAEAEGVQAEAGAGNVVAVAPGADGPDPTTPRLRAGDAGVAAGAPGAGDGPAAPDAASSDAGSSAASLWTDGGDAVSGLTAIAGDDASVGGVSAWDGLGGHGGGGGGGAESGYGLASDWAAWTSSRDDDEDDGGMAAAARRPVRVDLTGAPKMSFEELLEASAAGGAASILGRGVL